MDLESINLVTLGFFIGIGYAIAQITSDLLGYALFVTLRSNRLSLEQEENQDG